MTRLEIWYEEDERVAVRVDSTVKWETHRKSRFWAPVANNDPAIAADQAKRLNTGLKTPGWFVIREFREEGTEMPAATVEEVGEETR